MPFINQPVMVSHHPHNFSLGSSHGPMEESTSSNSAALDLLSLARNRLNKAGFDGGMEIRKRSWDHLCTYLYMHVYIYIYTYSFTYVYIYILYIYIYCIYIYCIYIYTYMHTYHTIYTYTYYIDIIYTSVSSVHGGKRSKYNVWLFDHLDGFVLASQLEDPIDPRSAPGLQPQHGARDHDQEPLRSLCPAGDQGTKTTHFRGRLWEEDPGEQWSLGNLKFNLPSIWWGFN